MAMILYIMHKKELKINILLLEQFAPLFIMIKENSWKVVSKNRIKQGKNPKKREKEIKNNKKSKKKLASKKNKC